MALILAFCCGVTVGAAAVYLVTGIMIATSIEHRTERSARQACTRPQLVVLKPRAGATRSN